MPSCAIATCKNNQKNIKNKGIALFHFPTDPKLQKEWLKKCRRADKVNVSFARICSVHFKESDYVRDLQNELLGLPQRKKLKPGAVPSINEPLPEEKVQTERSTRCHSRTVRKNALERFRKLPNPTSAGTKVVKCTINPLDIASITKTIEKSTQQIEGKSKDIGVQVGKSQSDVDFEQRLVFLEEELIKARELIGDLKNAADLSKQKAEVSERRLKMMQVRLDNVVGQSEHWRTKFQESVRYQNEKSTNVRNKIHDLLKGTFTEAQITCLLRRKSRTVWKKEDIVLALELKSISNKAYKYLRKNWKIPLPGPTTLNRWIAKYGSHVGQSEENVSTTGFDFVEGASGVPIVADNPIVSVPLNRTGKMEKFILPANISSIALCGKSSSVISIIPTVHHIERNTKLIPFTVVNPVCSSSRKSAEDGEP